MVKFREFVLSTGRKVFGGKNSASNDELVFAASGDDVLLHTEAPGSPFVNVGVDATKGELKEAAVFCARYSQDWRDNKKDVVVKKFFRRDMKRGRGMKEGSWAVSKDERIVVKRVDILRFEEGLHEE